MPTQTEYAQAFRTLHIPGDPLVLFNIWDAGSAQAVAKAGAKALATGSWSVAAAHGYADGEKLPLELALANLQRIVAAVNLPVTLDFEAGYGTEPAAVFASVGQAIAAGSIGINFEDRIIGADGLYSIPEQSERIRAARKACDQAGIPAYINARTDVFLKVEWTTHDDKLLSEALQRATAYAEAGASGLFVPGLVDETLIGKLCKASPLPVNIMVFPNAPPSQRLAELGVARISYGPRPFRLAMQQIEDAAREAHSAMRR